MRILFLSIINEKRRKEVEIELPNLALAYLASYLEKFGGFSDITILETSVGSLHRHLERLKPDLVGISSVTQHFNLACEAAHIVKDTLKCPVIVGGHHITALPNNLSQDMDVAVLGEGEETMLQLANIIEQHGLIPSELEKIKGIAYRFWGNLKVTEHRPLITPLDHIPFPRRELLQLETDSLIHMLTSRGCVYQCAFCSSSAFWNGIRFFSARYVVEEIAEIIDVYSPRVIGFYDDLFSVNKKRIREIARLLDAEGLRGNVQFTCTARANLVTSALARDLKHIGVYKVSLGLESGNDKTLQYLKQGLVTVRDNANAINILKKMGFQVLASFVIGSPEESRADILDTRDFIRNSKLDGFGVYVLLPLPATEVWQYAKQQGLVQDQMDWSRFEIYFDEQQEDRVIVSPLPREELAELLRTFNVESDRRRYKKMLLLGLKHPLRAIRFIHRKIKLEKKMREIDEATRR